MPSGKRLALPAAQVSYGNSLSGWGRARGRGGRRLRRGQERVGSFQERLGPCGRSPPCSALSVWACGPIRGPRGSRGAGRRPQGRRSPALAARAGPGLLPRTRPGPTTPTARPSNRDPSFARASPAPRPSAATAPPTSPQAPPRATPPARSEGGDCRDGGRGEPWKPLWEPREPDCGNELKLGGVGAKRSQTRLPNAEPPTPERSVVGAQESEGPCAREAGLPAEGAGLLQEGAGLPSPGPLRLDRQEGNAWQKRASSSLRRSPPPFDVLGPPGPSSCVRESLKASDQNKAYLSRVSFSARF